MPRYLYTGAAPAILAGFSYRDGTSTERQDPETARGTVTVRPGDILDTGNPAADTHPALHRLDTPATEPIPEDAR